MENFFHNNRFTFQTRENDEWTEDIFFCHEESYTLWRAFPEVLLIDTTYKTNMYDWPFVQFVGITSTSKTFIIANAFLMRETEYHFTWALEKLKELLDDLVEPRLIMTDRDLALMNSCEKVFPNATHNLCRWHISENIMRRFKRLYRTEAGKGFTYWWKVLYESPTQQRFQYNCSKWETKLAEEGFSGKFFICVPLKQLTAFH